MNIEDVKASAQALREKILNALYAFDSDTGHMHPDVSISWMDVTQFQDNRVVYKPIVRVEVKVSV